MSDADRERLTLPAAHGLFPQPPAPGSYTGTTTITSASAAPPFAPRPHYNQTHHHHHHQHRTHGTATSSRSGGTSTHTDHIPPSATSSSSTECTCHEVCYYFQQAIFILAIMTGVALIIAGTVMHIQNGELLVFVYIGVLLASVNTVLLMIQCCVRQKQKRRARAYQAAARPSAVQASTQTGGMVRYKTLTVSSGAEKPPMVQTLPTADIQPFQYKHYHMHSPNVGQPSFQDFPVGQEVFAQSPTESAQSKFLHGAPYHRSGSVVSHHRHTKGPAYHKSPPLGQVHRPLLSTVGPQLPRSDVGLQEGFSPLMPPPSYDDLLRSGRLPQENTIVHLI